MNTATNIVTVNTVERRGQVLSKAHDEWASRPADQRFQTVEDLLKFCDDIKNRSRQKDINTGTIRAETHEKHGLVLRGPGGGLVRFTNWSFQQLCRLLGTSENESIVTPPAGYLMSKPSGLAAECLNHDLERSGRDIKALLTTDNSDIPILRAMTSPKYARVWNADALSWVDNLTSHGGWKLPLAYKDGKFGAEKVPSGAYASDRDCFLFMVDESRPIILPDGRNLFRGFFFWNSEVGSQTYGFDAFLYDKVCGNHYVWGAELLFQIRRRHIGEMLLSKAYNDVVKTIQNAANSSDEPFRKTITLAQSTLVDSEPNVWLREKGFAKFEADGGVRFARTEEGDSRTVWQLVQGLTAFARSTYLNRDKRTDLERRAGSLLEPFVEKSTAIVPTKIH